MRVRDKKATWKKEEMKGYNLTGTSEVGYQTSRQIDKQKQQKKGSFGCIAKSSLKPLFNIFGSLYICCIRSCRSFVYRKS